MYASDLKHPVPSLEDKLNKLYTLNRDKKIDLSFRPPYLDLLESYGQPHLNLPPVIHVAGTNGKGSTIALMRAILEEAGYSVHTYTSPHLCAFNERLCLAGQEIDNETLENLVDEALGLGAEKALTFFEITTAMAFAAFSRIPADILLLETGLGGRLDCTNVIKAPLATIITSVSYDHTEYLGESLCEIAGEKAGVMKENSTCIIGAQNKHAIDEGIINVFESKAKELNIPLLCYDADWFIEQKDDLICFSFENNEHVFPLPNLTGNHQIQNAGAALTALHSIRDVFPITPEAIKSGLNKVQWHARLQRLTNSGYGLNDNWEIWLDGGHNEGAAQAIAEQAKKWAQDKTTPLHLIIGMMGHKNPAGYLGPLVPFLDSITTVDIGDEPDALSGKKLAELLRAGHPTLDIKQGGSYLQAIKDLKSNQPAGRILIAGSLYLAGHVLQDQKPAS